jgi:uncharacterized protein (AIM24 family)
MAERDGTRPPSSRSRDVAGEEFLFHLYRGSELLQDNRVHDAKAELEHALTLQPSDPKGQDLLGIVYFRLGLYPHAIAIYERLIQMHPNAIEPRINLALSYLKTGQPAQARVELEKVVEQNPGHSRAWGYLGLAFQRLGDYERASYAFAAGGHDAMARRLLETASPAANVSIRSEPPLPTKAEVRRIAGEAFQELDRAISEIRADEDAFQLAGPTTEPATETHPGPIEIHRGPVSGVPSSRDFRSIGSFTADGPRTQVDGPRTPVGTWAAIEPGREQITPPARLPAMPPPSTMPISRSFISEGPSSSLRRPAPTTAPKRAGDLAREMLVVFPRDLPVSVHSSGMVLVQTPHGFAARIESVRSLAYAAGYGTTVLQRRVRGRNVEEPLGGHVSPIVEITGKGELVLGTATGQRLHAIQLDDETIYLREDALVGLDLSITYENGRLPSGDGEAISMVQLRGYGVVVASLPERATAIETTEVRSTAVRAITVLGWTGRLVPRALLSTESPAGVRGFIAFAGEGMVMVDGR